MSEAEVIQGTDFPATRSSIAADLARLGMLPGMTVLVHSSLHSLGWVCGGAHAVVLALLDVLGDDGTLVMPTHTSALSDPVFWCNPPVPTNWWTTIREEMPAYDPEVTPTLMMGCIPELFRTWPGTVRSLHPQYSFAAHGPRSREVTDRHQFNFGLGDGSPLGRLYELDAHVLLLGVGHDRNTSLHLAEQRMNPVLNKRISNGAPVLRDGRRLWVPIEDYELSSHDFAAVGQQFSLRANNSWQSGLIAAASSELFSQRQLVDFATPWFEKNR